MNTYECQNTACPLGRPDQPGRFTGGASPRLLNILTGEPVADEATQDEPIDGVCPSCGVKGTKVKAKDEHVPHEEAGDPNQAAHDAIGARVADPDDQLTNDGAQHALLEVVTNG